MNKKFFFTILILEIVLYGQHLLFRVQPGDEYSYFILSSFPQIADALRSMSTANEFGNVIAIILYVGICLLPTIMMLYLIKKKYFLSSDLLLPILSILLFIVIYYMINPVLFSIVNPESTSIFLCSIFFSVTVGYLVLRLIQMSKKAHIYRLQKNLQIVLYILAYIFVYCVMIELFVTLPSRLDVLASGNSSTDWLTGLPVANPGLSLTQFSLVLRSMVEVIPLIFDVLLLYKGIILLDHLAIDRYSESSVKLCGKMARLCVLAISVTILFGIFYELVQLIFHEKLYDIKTTISFPLTSIILVFIFLIFSGFIRESQKLKQDNDLFI